jgi:hypothetical protein
MTAKLNTSLMLAILAAVLWVAVGVCARPESGRYVEWDDESAIAVLDTATGLVYAVDAKENRRVVCDPKNGRLDVRPMKPDAPSAEKDSEKK